MARLLCLVALLCASACHPPIAPDDVLHDCVIRYQTQPDGSIKPINSCAPK
jgi:hypothetical protein